MTERELRKAESRRLMRRISAHIDDFPRQNAALESAMGAFGQDFDFAQFKRAFETADDIEA